MTRPPLPIRSLLVPPGSSLDSSGRQLAWWLGAVILLAGLNLGGSTRAGDEAKPTSTSAAERFRAEIEPILADHCSGCHGNGIKKGGVSLDGFKSDEDLLAQRDLWHNVLKNVRAGLMPPPDEDRPSTAERQALEHWIKRDAFQLDPNNPDPGRVTLRRLNRVEYRNTVRDLMGIDFRADEEFPADDSGYGFDNIGDVLSVSPLLLEKYLQAAETIVNTAVPTIATVVRTRTLSGSEFTGENGKNGDGLSLYEPAQVARTFHTAKTATYKMTVNLAIQGDFYSDPGRAQITVQLDDKPLIDQEFSWENYRTFSFPHEVSLDAGEHRLTCQVEPLLPASEKKTYVNLKVRNVQLDGPLDPSDWMPTPGYDRFFPHAVPLDATARRSYAREILNDFATRAFRRPVADRVLDRLVAIAEEGSNQPDSNFEKGVGRAMVAALASPRFLFRVEENAPVTGDATSALVDEYALASRLSYFLWSTMPDATLFNLAHQGELRARLADQVQRMLADDRSRELVKNFTGQWLQARDYENFPIQHKFLFRRENLPPKKDNEVAALRRAMRQETEAYIDHVIRADRPVLELLDSDYTFVNQTLAEHYEIPGVEGREIRKVTLPADSPRGGLLTQGGILMVTSNPTRTSPVKRGQFILENILGTPSPPPPPDIPSLEDTIRSLDRVPTTREVMAIHRQDPLCASCHNRMDPLGLAFENFNALGSFRTTERRQPIDASGKLVTGRTFQNAVELKKILVREYRDDFYRCLTEKLLTYALGRGVESHDVETVDAIVARLDKADGRFSALLTGIIESAPFQKRRVAPVAVATAPTVGDRPSTSSTGANE